jgi:hypothetical protein
MEMRCGCKVEGKTGERVIEPCEQHDEWMKALVRAEREECARLADAWSELSSYAAGVLAGAKIAEAIRGRTPL